MTTVKVAASQPDITNATAETSIAGGDEVLAPFDASAGVIRKGNRTNAALVGSINLTGPAVARMINSRANRPARK